MFGIILFILAVGGLTALGWWKGGARLGLALAPLLICSIFLWLAGGIAYEIDMMRNLGEGAAEAVGADCDRARRHDSDFAPGVDERRDLSDQLAEDRRPHGAVSGEH